MVFDDKSSGRTARDKILPILVSHDERRELKQLATTQGMTVADFIRASINLWQSKITPRDTIPIRKCDPELLAAVGRLGVNLNQIAKWANEYKSSADATQIISALAAIERELMLSVKPLLSVEVMRKRKEKREIIASDEAQEAPC